MPDEHSTNNLSNLVIGALSGLPNLVSKSAVGALNRLVTGVTDVPATLLAGWKEQLEDGNYERRSLRRGLADAAIAKATSDDAIVQRTVERLIGDQLRKQKNREAIAIEAARIISDKEDCSANENTLDEDWLNSYIKYAEDLSSERAQELWARVLVGEIGRTGSFSLPTLRFLAELDQATAQRIEMVFSHSFGNLIPLTTLGSKGPLFSEARLLEEVGLISGVTGNFGKPFTDTITGQGALHGRDCVLILYGPSASEKQFSAAFISKIGQEIANIISPNDSATAARSVFTSISHDGILAAALWPVKEGKVVFPPEMLMGTIEDMLSLTVSQSGKT